MSSYDRAVELAEKITAEGIHATPDPRGAIPPCVLVTPPGRTYDLGCGYTAAWNLIVLAPTTANADTFKLLDEMVDTLAGIVDVQGATFISYALSPDNPTWPAYRVTFDEAIAT